VRTSRICFQQAGPASASCGRQAGLPNRKADAVLAPNQNIENNPMQSNKVSLAWMLSPQKPFDTSGKSPA
jgi:hypothetical protein